MTLHRMIIFYQNKWTMHCFFFFFRSTYLYVSWRDLFSYNLLTEWRLNSWNWTMASCLCKVGVRNKWLYCFTELHLCILKALLMSDLCFFLNRSPNRHSRTSERHFREVGEQQIRNVALQTRTPKLSSLIAPQHLVSGDLWREWKLMGTPS